MAWSPSTQRMRWALAKRRQRERQAQAVAAAAVSHEADVQEVQARRVGRNLGFAQVQMSNEETHTPVVEGGAGEDSPAGRQEGQGVKSSTARVRKHRERQRALAAASGIGECSVRHKQDMARQLAHQFLGLTSAYTADCRRDILEMFSHLPLLKMYRPRAAKKKVERMSS